MQISYFILLESSKLKYPLIINVIIVYSTTTYRLSLKCNFIQLSLNRIPKLHSISKKINKEKTEILKQLATLLPNQMPT